MSGFGDLSVLRTEADSVLQPLTTEHMLGPTPPAFETVLRFIEARQPRLRFGRMFPTLAGFRPPPESLIELGQAMGKSTASEDHPSLSAGYTYLGQFIDHDITFDLTREPPPVAIPVEKIPQGRTPSLDLDSLYGGGPDAQKPGEAKCYEDDGVRFRIGTTKYDLAFDVKKNLDNDLPRTSLSDQTAVIGDPRNDENLAVAQTTLAFIKFHNAVASTLAKDYSGSELFNETRRKVVKHYQWIVLHDFLRGLIDTDVLDLVRNEGGKHFLPQADVEPFMPVEFSRAAFRVGHSQVRNEYEWNRFIQSSNRATLTQLLAFTGFRGGHIFGHDRLPTTWIIDWTRFFDFDDYPGQGKNPLLNFTKKLDTSLAKEFANLPIPKAPPEMRSLAVIDLLRGWEVELPAGQTVVQALQQAAANPEKIRRLTPSEVAHKHPEVIQHYGFDQVTPLWYYILREAEVLWNGTRLGPVGSYIVAETFIGLIKASAISILRKEQPSDADWGPDLGRVQAGRFNMADLLYFVDDLNPLAKL